MVDEHVLDLLPGYAFGILEEAELEKVDRHLPRCATCQAELAVYAQTLDQLMLAEPLQAPPQDLKARILQRVTEQSQQAAVRETAAPAPVPASDHPGFLASLHALFATKTGWAVGIALLAVIVFFGISNLLLWQQVHTLQANVPGGNIHVVELLGTSNAPQAVGYVMVFKGDRYGALAVENAPVLDSAHQYQIWLIRNGKRVSGGVFSVNEWGYGTLEVQSTQPLDTYQSFGITVEPQGGSPAPTGKKILGGDL